MPLPDRNPNTGAPPPLVAAQEISLLSPQTSLAPAPPTPLAAPQPALLAPHVGLDDTPLPDPNPNRKATLPIVMKGTLTPAIQAPVPGMDYVAVLKPLTDYQLSAGDEANLRDVLRGGGAISAAEDSRTKRCALSRSGIAIATARSAAPPMRSSSSASRIPTGPVRTTSARKPRRSCS